MELTSNDQLSALRAGRPLDPKLVLLPPQARNQEAAGKCAAVDEPEPQGTYPVAHRQSS